MMRYEDEPDKVILWGQSCVGKTFFALHDLTQYSYLCFDSLFRWHDIETLGLSCSVNLREIAGVMEDSKKCVLDGWHLSDCYGELSPTDAVFYVVYASYACIIKQYRVPVADHQEHYHMFRKWYGVDFAKFRRRTRYFVNEGDFREIGLDDFERCIKKAPASV